MLFDGVGSLRVAVYGVEGTWRWRFQLGTLHRALYWRAKGVGPVSGAYLGLVAAAGPRYMFVPAMYMQPVGGAPPRESVWQSSSAPRMAVGPVRVSTSPAVTHQVLVSRSGTHRLLVLPTTAFRRHSTNNHSLLPTSQRPRPGKATNHIRPSAWAPATLKLPKGV